MDTKKKHNPNNIVSWVFTFSFLVLATVIMFDYMNFDNPTIQTTAIFIVEILLTVIFILLLWFDAIQQELYDIKNSLYDIEDSLEELYDLKQINDLRSTVNKRHLEKLLNDIHKKLLMIYTLEEKTNESKD